MALAINLFSSAHLEKVLSLLVLSLDDYLDLLSSYILSVQPEFHLLSRFLRLIRFTESYFELDIHSDWMIKMRQKCLEANPLNGLLFASILFFHQKKKEFQEMFNFICFGVLKLKSRKWSSLEELRFNIYDFLGKEGKYTCMHFERF